MNKRVLFMLGAIVLLSGIAVACSGTGDLEDRIQALEQERHSLSEQIESLNDQMVRANMVATLNLLDDVGFHHLNTMIREGGEAPAGTNGLIRTALRAVAVTDWPDHLDAGAQDLQQTLQGFFDALRGDDASVVPDASQAAHDTYHEFTGDAWDFLADSAGLGPGGAQEGHESDMDMDMDMDMGNGMDGMDGGG